MISYICGILKNIELVKQMNVVARDGGPGVDTTKGGKGHQLPLTNQAMGCRAPHRTLVSDALVCMTAGGESVFRVLTTRKKNSNSVR